MCTLPQTRECLHHHVFPFNFRLVTTDVSFCKHPRSGWETTPVALLGLQGRPFVSLELTLSVTMQIGYCQSIAQTRKIP